MDFYQYLRLHNYSYKGEGRGGGGGGGGAWPPTFYLGSTEYPYAAS